VRREVGVTEVAAHVDEAEVVVDQVGVVHRRPEADRDAAVVQPGDLRLHRTGEVLAGEDMLAERRDEIPLVRLALGARAEVAGDLAPVVDAEQLVEGDVTRVVNGAETVGGGGLVAGGALLAGAGLAVLALAADVVRASAPAARTPDATVAAATRRAFFLIDLIVLSFLNWLVQSGGSAASHAGERRLELLASAEQRPEGGVGWPLARMVLLVPWCRLRYQPVAGSGVVTPVTVRTSWLIWPWLSAVKSISMYWTGPWLMQLPRWMCAACAPGSGRRPSG